MVLTTSIGNWMENQSIIVHECDPSKTEACCRLLNYPRLQSCLCICFHIHVPPALPYQLPVQFSHESAKPFLQQSSPSWHQFSCHSDRRLLLWRCAEEQAAHWETMEAVGGSREGGLHGGWVGGGGLTELKIETQKAVAFVLLFSPSLPLIYNFLFWRSLKEHFVSPPVFFHRRRSMLPSLLSRTSTRP